MIREGQRLERRGSVERPTQPAGLPRSTLSTADPIERGGIVEILDHSEDAIDLSRAADGLPLLANHRGHDWPVGRVNNIRVEGDTLRGDLILSSATQVARDAAALIEDGTLRDISIGANVNRVDVTDTEDGPPIVRITSWTPIEASLASVGADPRPGIGRSLEDPPAMDTDTDTAPEPAPQPVPSEAEDANHARIQTIMRSAQAAIDAVPAAADAVRAARDAAILDRSVSAAQAGQNVLSALGELHVADIGGGHIGQGADASDRLMTGMERALCIRAEVGEVDPGEAASNPFTSYTLVEMAREFARSSGLEVSGMGRSELVRTVITRAVDGTAANTSATYPLLLENVLRKSIYAGFEEWPRTWDRWCQVGRTEDYKEFSRPGLSHFQDLAVVAENGEFLEGTFAEKTERATMVKYGRRYSITLEALINDDLGAFSEKGPKMGEAAARLVDGLPYALLLANPTMVEGGRTLFVATPGDSQNEYTDAISETAINANRVATIRRKDPNDVDIYPQLQYILHPPELTMTVDKLLNDAQIPVSVGSGAAREHNTVAGRYTAVEVPQFTNAKDWYTAASRGTIEMVFLDGQQTPQLEREQGFTHDTMWMKVRQNAVALAVDWRGLNFNNVP